MKARRQRSRQQHSTPLQCALCELYLLFVLCFVGERACVVSCLSASLCFTCVQRCCCQLCCVAFCCCVVLRACVVYARVVYVVVYVSVMEREMKCMPDAYGGVV